MTTIFFASNRNIRHHSSSKGDLFGDRFNADGPQIFRVGEGSEFVSWDLDLWAYANDVTLDFSRPGNPTDNAFIEAFNGRFPAECLNANWFRTLADAREKMEAWLRYYNEDRPHGAIGYKALIGLANPGIQTGQLPR